MRLGHRKRITATPVQVAALYQMLNYPFTADVLRAARQLVHDERLLPD